MTDIRSNWRAYLRAYGVHLYTASGVIFAFLTAIEICKPSPDVRWVFVWLSAALFIDSTDGPLARRWNTKKWGRRISGRTIDDIVDYLTFTFLPLLLVWRMDWLPAPAGVWVALAMTVSLFGFANVGAKEEEEGFFLGFPSYWNIYAYYMGPLYLATGPWVPCLILLLLTFLTIVPIRFIYPNLAPQPWRTSIWYGAAAWLILLFLILPWYPALPGWIVWVSLIYPVYYTALSIWLNIAPRFNR